MPLGPGMKLDMHLVLELLVFQLRGECLLPSDITALQGRRIK
jgi:hypothetical protein